MKTTLYKKEIYHNLLHMELMKQTYEEYIYGRKKIIDIPWDKLKQGLRFEEITRTNLRAYIEEEIEILNVNNESNCAGGKDVFVKIIDQDDSCNKAYLSINYFKDKDYFLVMDNL